jgi:hypothetical protein
MNQKPPPLLLGAALLFWGWQTGFFFAGALMAIVLEAAHVVKVRWDLTHADFSRLWAFCSVVFLATIVYAFTSNEGPADFRGFFENPSFLTQRNAGVATARTAAALFRWLPMSFFLFIAAQQYSVQGAIPLQTISLLLSLRWRKARKLGQPPGPVRNVNVGYIYFALCLFAASIHVSEDEKFFWGVCILAAWALWPQRSRRFALPLWAAVLGLAVAGAYYGQRGLGHLQSYISNLNPSWLSGYGHHRFDASLSRTELGSIGRIKTSAKIVIRVQTGKAPPPPLLREASYPNFRGRTWHIEAPEKRLFDDIKSETNETTYVLVRGKTNTSIAQISCYLAGGKALLPLPAASGRLDNLMAFSLKRNNFGALLDEGPGLVIFNALYGPGAMLDSAPEDNDDLLVSSLERPAVEHVATDLHLDDQSPADRLKTIAGFFARHFTYSTWQKLEATADTNETAIARFLLHNHKGHCEYFATAGVMLLRRAGIPARYAVGYAVHEPSGAGGYVPGALHGMPPRGPGATWISLPGHGLRLKRKAPPFSKDFQTHGRASCLSFQNSVGARANCGSTSCGRWCRFWEHCSIKSLSARGAINRPATKGKTSAPTGRGSIRNSSCLNESSPGAGWGGKMVNLSLNGWSEPALSRRYSNCGRRWRRC